MATKYSSAFKNTKMLKMLKLPNLSLLNIWPRYGQKPFCLVYLYIKHDIKLYIYFFKIDVDQI